MTVLSMTGGAGPAGSDARATAPTATAVRADGSAWVALALADAARAGVTRPLPQAVRAVIDALLCASTWTGASVRLVPALDGTETITSDPLADACERLQFRIGAGPTIDALRTDLQAATDLTGDARWRTWSAAAVARGIGAVAAVRLHASTTVGSLTLFARGPVDVETDVPVARLAAAQLSILVAAATRHHHLEVGMQSRTRIGQAQGILMHRYGLSAPQAFGLLVRTSQQHNIKVAALARLITATGGLPAELTAARARGDRRPE